MKLAKSMILIGALAAAANVARADSFEWIPDGAPVYGVLRWGSIIDQVNKVGWNKLPAYEEFKRTSGNIDLLNPAMYVPTGVDINAPIAMTADGAAALSHIRLVGHLADKNIMLAVLSASATDKSSGIKMFTSATPAGKLGIIASVKIDKWLGTLRLDGDMAIVDLVTGTGAKLLTPDKIAAKYPLKPATAVALTTGTRALLGGDRLAAVTVDARKAEQLAYLIGQFVPRDKNQLPLATCLAQTAKMPTTFDDTGAALTLAGVTPQLEVAWGASAGKGLKLTATDDGAVNAARLQKESVAHLGIFGINLAAFRALPTTGMPAIDRMDKMVDQCPTTVGVAVFLRSWPHLLAAGISKLDKNPQDLGPAAGLVTAINQVRSVFFAFRSLPNGNAPPTWVTAVSAGESFRGVVEGLLTIVGLSGAPRTVGNHKVTFYDGSALQDLKFVAAIEGGQAPSTVAMTGASSDEALRWAYGNDTPRSGAATAIASGHMDGALLRTFAKDAEDQKYLAPINRIEAELRSDDLFRAILRVQFNQ